jgi:hypothetical protein
MERLAGLSGNGSRALAALPLGAAVAACIAAGILGHFAADHARGEEPADGV